MASHIRIVGVALILLFLNVNLSIAWGGNEKVLLKDIDVLTLYHGKMTKGSRSSPVQQLECVGGGTAPCNTFKPRVVQCYNRGSDGADVQWECKADMDNAYRFGEIEVSCEGYNYPDDPYVLKGSCGLRYSIDYTMEGHQQNNKQHNYYGESQSSNNYGSNSHNYYNTKSSKSWNFADIIVLGAVGLMIYAFYVTCVRPSRHVGEDANSTTNEDYPSGGSGGGYGWHAPSAPPPPGSGRGTGGGGTYGFNTDYTDGASCGRNRGNHSRSSFGASGGSGGGGFWTGAATGGLLGYMFGNRNTYGNNRGYGGGWGGGARGYGGGFSGGGFSGGGFSGGGSSGSSGTRSASGFGGTSRR